MELLLLLDPADLIIKSGNSLGRRTRRTRRSSVKANGNKRKLMHPGGSPTTVTSPRSSPGPIIIHVSEWARESETLSAEPKPDSFVTERKR